MGNQAADLLARWRHADERLYPMVMVHPERYTQIVSVVRAASDLLASETCLDELVEARRRGRAIVSRAAEAVGIPLELLSVELVADAAFHLRYGELTAERHRHEVADTIAAARAQAERWVVVAESGKQDQPAVQPYQRIEMRVDDGLALRGWIDVDPHTFAPVHGLEELRLDPNTGVMIDAEPAATRTYATRQQWEAAWNLRRDRAP